MLGFHLIQYSWVNAEKDSIKLEFTRWEIKSGWTEQQQQQQKEETRTNTNTYIHT